MDEIKQLAEEFRSCQKLLTAIGDENRLHLMVEMMQMNSCRGVRVGEITKRTHLSRPAVSHHLQILREAGILGVRKEGTKKLLLFRFRPPHDEAAHRSASACGGYCIRPARPGRIDLATFARTAPAVRAFCVRDAKISYKSFFILS